MATSRETLFNLLDNTVNNTTGELDSNTNDLKNWNPPCTFQRTNPVPLEKRSVFKSLSDAQNYASKNELAYPGQVLSVIPATRNCRSILYSNRWFIVKISD